MLMKLRVVWNVWKRWEQVGAVYDEMHKVMFPGDYGLGDAGDDKEAWEKIGSLWEELGELLYSK